MEGLGWWIYLCSIIDGIKTTVSIILIMGMIALIATSVIYVVGDCSFKTAQTWWKWGLMIGIPALLLFIFTPEKKTMYQIVGVTIATEVVKNSEALQELPEKSFEALNRLLDSIASEEEKEEKK